MKKKITGSVLSAGAIVLGLAAAGCGGAIENAANGWAMLGYTLLAIVLGCAALALAGLGLVEEQRKEPQKIHKVPENMVTTSHRKQNLSIACGDSSPNRGAFGRASSLNWTNEVLRERNFMDKTQCVHVFEITRSRCLSCAGRNRACGEYEERRSYHENKDEPFGGDGPDPGQRGAADLLVWADRLT